MRLAQGGKEAELRGCALPAPGPECRCRCRSHLALHPVPDPNCLASIPESLRRPEPAQARQAAGSHGRGGSGSAPEAHPCVLAGPHPAGPQLCGQRRCDAAAPGGMLHSANAAAAAAPPAPPCRFSVHTCVHRRLLPHPALQAAACCRPASGGRPRGWTQSRALCGRRARVVMPSELTTAACFGSICWSPMLCSAAHGCAWLCSAAVQQRVAGAVNAMPP